MNASRPFKPLRRTTISEQVREEILTRIASGELQPGAQLPAERVLTQEFGVARTSVREAIQALVAIGVVERRGNRSYVTERLPGADVGAGGGRLKTIRDLLAARRLLERLLFGLAASRATARERQRAMELARLPIPKSLQELILADRQFHGAIASACGNPVLSEVYGRVVEALMMENLSPEILMGISEDIDESEAIARVVSEHITIAEAFIAGDVEGMLDAGECHVGPVEGWIGSATSPIRGRARNAAMPGLDRTVGM
ncbi:MAG: GntR family transcriptional regulator [Actinomycetota bacterium]